MIGKQSKTKCFETTSVKLDTIYESVIEETSSYNDGSNEFMDYDEKKLNNPLTCEMSLQCSIV